jgi:protein-tyrosine phosphatase
MPSFDKITDHIFLGNVYSVIGDYRIGKLDILDDLNINVVISALTEEEYDDYMILSDDFVNNIIKKAIKENKIVIVHCAAGISRSSTLVIAHLMIENNWSMEQAIQYVKERRPQIQPNDGFIKQLKTLEYKIKQLKKWC